MRYISSIIGGVLVGVLALPLVALAAQWTENGQDIYYNAGNVGINETTPETKLQILDGSVTITTDKSNLRQPRLPIDDDEVLRGVGFSSDYIISLHDGTGRVQHYWNAQPTDQTYLESDEAAGKIHFNPPSLATWFALQHAEPGIAGDPISWRTDLAIQNNGNVSLGGTEGLDRLHVQGGDVRISDQGNAELLFEETNNAGSDTKIVKGGTNDLYIRQFNNANMYQLGTQEFIVHTANVGLGTLTPTEKLEVEGNIKLSGNLVSDGDICIGACN